jgi:hypothetical protein
MTILMNSVTQALSRGLYEKWAVQCGFANNKAPNIAMADSECSECS